MSFFISEAMAATGQSVAEQPAGGLSVLIMPIMFLVAFYFILWRPQSKRAKEQKEMIGGIQKGDEIVTAGGMLGKVTGVTEKFLRITVADDIEIKIQRQAVNSVLPKGTLKSI